MKFHYDVISTNEVDIDFGEVYRFVEADTKSHDPDYIHDTFLDDMCYYLEEIYELYDIEDGYFIDSVMTGWTNYIEDNYEV